MGDEKTVQDGKISDLEKHQAVLDVKLDNLAQNLVEIKTNHLVHINDQLTIVNRGVLDLGTLLNTKISEIYSKISEIRINDAKQEPSVNIMNKVIEYIIIAIVGAGIAILVSKVK